MNNPKPISRRPTLQQIVDRINESNYRRREARLDLFGSQFKRFERREFEIRHRFESQ